MSIKQDGATQFWIAGKLGSREYQAFLGTGDKIVLSDDTGGTSFVFGASLWSRHAGRLRLTQRFLSIRSGSRKYLVSMDGRGMVSSDGKLHCSIVPQTSSDVRPEFFTTTHDAHLPSGTFYAGVRVDITPLIQKQQDQLPANGNRVEIGQANGWLKLSAVNASRIEDADIGSTHLLVAQRGVSFLELDDMPMKLSREKAITAVGTFSGHYDSKGDIVFRGRAFGVWQDQQRLTKTRWERLPNNIQLGIFGGLLPALWGILKVARPAWIRFNRPDPLLLP